MSAVIAPGDGGTFNMEAAIVRLFGLSARLREARSLPTGRGPFSIGDFPEPTSQWTAAHADLRQFGEELGRIGGLNLMVDVYDTAVERRDHRAVCGVSAAWTGLHGWMH